MRTDDVSLNRSPEIAGLREILSKILAQLVENVFAAKSWPPTE